MFNQTVSASTLYGKNMSNKNDMMQEIEVKTGYNPTFAARMGIRALLGALNCYSAKYRETTTTGASGMPRPTVGDSFQIFTPFASITELI